MLLIGLILLAAALLLVLMLLLAPKQPAIPIERRRPYRVESTSRFSRWAGSAADNLTRYLSEKKFRLYGRDELENAGLHFSQGDFVILVMAGGSVAALLGFVIAGPLLALLFLVLTPLGANTLLKYLSGKRRRKFDLQLGDTLQLLTGSLRAGHSILRAIDAAATESASPTAEEMRRVVTETSLGKDMLSALDDTAERMKSEDFLWIAQAIQINREVGGNLAEVLDQVGETIRERSEIKGQVQALAAEGKFSAYILLALPFGVILMLLMISPGYMDPMFENPLGWILIGVSVVLMTIGSLWLRKIIDLKF
jgi:tight adherence protein B